MYLQVSRDFLATSIIINAAERTCRFTQPGAQYAAEIRSTMRL